MQPYIWGKYLWTSIHYISLGYSQYPTNDEKIEYKDFFENLFKVLPCYACSQNYKEHLIKLPITDEVLKNTKSLFKWTVDLHNLVNKNLDKKITSVEEAYQLYTKVHPNNNQTMIDCFANLSKIKKESTVSQTWLLLFNIFLVLIIFSLIFMRKSFQKLF